MYRAILISIIIAFSSTKASAAPPSSAPPNVCTAHFRMWCAIQLAKATTIRDDGDEVVALTSDTPQKDEDPLIVIAPPSCATGNASEMTFKGLTLDQVYDGRLKDELRVALSSTCEIKILLPKWRADSFNWPYQIGLEAIRPCPNRECVGPQVGELKPRFAIKYRRQLLRP